MSRRDSSHLLTQSALHGFVVLDGAGEFIAWAEHAEVATRRMREDTYACEVRRCSDDVRIAHMLRKPVTWGYNDRPGSPDYRIPVRGCS